MRIGCGALPDNMQARRVIHFLGTNRVGRGRAGGDDADAWFAGDAGIAVGAMAGGLFVAVENEFGGGPIKLIENREDGSAGIAEHHFDFVLLDEQFMKDLSAALALEAG